MATLIIEIQGRNGSQYHKIEKAAVRVGRALDNDIILSDPSVSAHHFVVRKTSAGLYELHSLADENGIRRGRQQISDPLLLTGLPIAFDAGRTHIRILDSSQAVAPARLITCRNGATCLFGHWGWALAAFAIMLLLSAADNYLSTHRILTWESFWRDQVVITVSALVLSLGLLVINRIASHRWDYPASLSFVSLMLIGAYLLDLLIPAVDYFFTSPLPGYAISIIWVLLILPYALGWFLISFHHGNTLTSVLFIILIVTPAAYTQVKAAATHYDLFDGFSKKAFYSSALYPWDKRLKPTISIDEFAEMSAQKASGDAADHRNPAVQY